MCKHNKIVMVLVTYYAAAPNVRALIQSDHPAGFTAHIFFSVFETAAPMHAQDMNEIFYGIRTCIYIFYMRM